ncbi:MAG TPA: amidase [Caldilineales bacterium]|nr:amidase [Caldilineales bacterium]
MTTPPLIADAPLAETAAALRSGQLDLFEYLDQLFARLDAVEPQVRAFVEEPDRRDRVMADAQALADAYPQPGQRPPLFGVPIGVKDIFHVAGLPTQAGSNLPPEALTGEEAAVVRLFKAAGALIMGKTVTTEFAFFEPGPTRNPHNLAHTPGGSSSGSAAAVAAGEVPLAIGTQTIGSVIRPAAFCGVVGYKPSYHRIDPDGLIYFSPSADHVGLFTQDVSGMRLAAAAVCSAWDKDAKVVRKPTLGIPTGPYLEQASAEGLAAFRQQVERLRDAGYEVREIPHFNNITDINRIHRQLIAAEFAQQHARWFDAYRDLYRPRTVALIQEGREVPDEVVEEARDLQKLLREEVVHIMDVNGVDLWVTPAAPGPAPEGLNSTGDPIMNLPWTFLGLPAVTVPAGVARNGLPLGLQMVGAWMMDEEMLAWAEDVQALFQ